MLLIINNIYFIERSGDRVSGYCPVIAFGNPNGLGDLVNAVYLSPPLKAIVGFPTLKIFHKLLVLL